MTKQEEFWFKCPGCGYFAGVDKEQALGQVSIDCPECDFHETGKISPLIFTSTPTNPKKFFSSFHKNA